MKQKTVILGFLLALSLILSYVESLLPLAIGIPGIKLGLPNLVVVLLLYLYGGREEQISQTIVNTLANVSGIVCDGAKSSCAAKIASAVDAAIVATMISLKGKCFLSGDGIVKDTIQKTIDGVVTLAKEGMKETDEVIVKIMLEK